MMKLDEKSNAQAWELEVTCRNKKYLDEVVKAILKYGMVNFEVQLVECLRTHEEAYNKATKVKWKVEPCFSGEDCWCRIIVPDEPINYGPDDIEEVCIVSSASINKQMAEHIVNINNEFNLVQTPGYYA